MKINGKRYSHDLKNVEEGTLSHTDKEILKLILSDYSLPVEYIRQISPFNLREHLEGAEVTYNGPERRCRRTDFIDASAVMVLRHRDRYAPNGWSTCSFHYYWKIVE